MERIVNIVGLGMSARNVGEGENWILNVAYKKIKDKKIDKMFFMDDFNIIAHQDSIIEPLDYKIENFIKDNPHVELISKFEGIVRSINGEELAPIKEYPLHQALALADGGYFTSTIAYAICYAILEKVDRLRLYGFDVWSGSDANEYTYQRPCIEFWLAFAMGRGMKIEMPYLTLPTSHNQQNYYGYNKFNLKMK